MVTTFTRPVLVALRAEIDAAVAAVGERHGIELKTGSAKFDASNVTFKLTGSIRSANGIAETPERSAFRRNAHRYGLSAEDLDQSIVVGGRSFRIAGLRPSAPRRPIVLEHGDDRRVCTVEAVLAALKRAA